MTNPSSTLNSNSTSNRYEKLQKENIHDTKYSNMKAIFTFSTWWSKVRCPLVLFQSMNDMEIDLRKLVYSIFWVVVHFKQAYLKNWIDWVKTCPCQCIKLLSQRLICHSFFSCKQMKGSFLSALNKVGAKIPEKNEFSCITYLYL